MDVEDTAAGYILTHFIVLYTCNYHYGDKQIQLAILICTKPQLVNYLIS